MVMVFAFRPGVAGSNYVRSLYFCYASVYLFLCYGLFSNFGSLTLSQTSPGFHVSAEQAFWKHCRDRRNCWWLWVWDPVEAKFLASHLCWSMWEKSRWLWKGIFVTTGVRKPEQICSSPTFIAVKVALNHNTPTNQSKLKDFADENFKFGESGTMLSKRVQNTVGKGEIARYEQFLFFPQCFQKTFTEET